jgi:hypothetical protein
VVGDVLDEDEGRLALTDDASDVRPEMARVVCPSHLAGDAEGLARVARREEIHDSTPRAAVEGSQIRPDRRLIQVSRRHARTQDFAGIGFDLHSADEASAWNRQSDSEVESGSSGGETEHIEGRLIHTRRPP